MWMRIIDLIPGMEFMHDTGDRAIYVGQIGPHPLYPNLHLVIWWMCDERRWSHDALSPGMELQHMKLMNGPSYYRDALAYVFGAAR